MKTAVFPGTFDPFTKGHQSVVNKVLPLFDKIIIAIGDNANKKSLFPAEQRVRWIKEVYKDESKVLVKAYNILTVDFCMQEKAGFIIRGLRSGSDFEYEQQIAQVNKKLAPHIETLFVLTDPEYASISSSIVREIYRYGRDISGFVPQEIKIEKR